MNYTGLGEDRGRTCWLLPRLDGIAVHGAPSCAPRARASVGACGGCVAGSSGRVSRETWVRLRRNPPAMGEGRGWGLCSESASDRTRLVQLVRGKGRDLSTLYGREGAQELASSYRVADLLLRGGAQHLAQGHEGRRHDRRHLRPVPHHLRPTPAPPLRRRYAAVTPLLRRRNGPQRSSQTVLYITSYI